MIDHGIADELVALAQAIARMKPPSNHNPHAFHEDRSELASQARSIAARLRAGPAPKQVEKLAPIGRQPLRLETRHIGSRTFQVLRRRQLEQLASDNRP
jgi:hypothetical protein